ncbi:formylglycine-generating enzyme family protein [Singulisphaera sp. Ch08]|uniref:Formylglycine-generating enzyme family protein n=1 Tax=Singulisphaera sp. Ch08 TaxID=3120278 RepID=A0AAU7CCZ9_9BACT
MALRPLLRTGLAVVAISLAANFLARLYHKPSAPMPALATTRGGFVQLAEGLPTKIDSDELVRAGQERDDNVLGMIFCWCPPGAFSLGGGPRNPSGRYLDSNPVWVTLSRGFWMGKFEVTQADWQRVMGKTLAQQRAIDPGRPRPLGDGSKRPHAGEGPNYPIYFMNHDEAEEFCFRLTTTERAAGRLEVGWVYCLPTEAQWEFACRAGTTTATAFGNRLGSVQANFDGTEPFNNAPNGPYHHGVMPIGSYPANAWGLHDMHGNVWEWCRDHAKPQPMSGTHSFRGLTSSNRAFRGGCWYDKGPRCLSTARAVGTVQSCGSGLGFRVALVSTELWKEANSVPQVPLQRHVESQFEP